MFIYSLFLCPWKVAKTCVRFALATYLRLWRTGDCDECGGDVRRCGDETSWPRSWGLWEVAKWCDRRLYATRSRRFRRLATTATSSCPWWDRRSCAGAAVTAACAAWEARMWARGQRAARRLLPNSSLWEEMADFVAAAVVGVVVVWVFCYMNAWAVAASCRCSWETVFRWFCARKSCCCCYC